MHVQFGDGVNGSRLPTGKDNIIAVYRKGISEERNVDAEGKERVEIWNSYFELAKEQAENLKLVITGKKVKKLVKPAGGFLNDKDFYKLSTILICNLAIEARINHLLYELKGDPKIGRTLFDSLEYSPAIVKWHFIPYYKTNKKINFGDTPHQAISTLCKWRSKLIHITYRILIEELKKIKPEDVLELYNGFVESMEDMNVLLNRIKKHRIEVYNKWKIKIPKKSILKEENKE